MADLISETRERAACSGGSSDNAIYSMVRRSIASRNIQGALAIDLGCGHGALKPILDLFFRDYIGVDAVRYDHFPAEARFVGADLNAVPFPLNSRLADATFAIETIEHLENPRALVREMVRLTKPGGWIVVSTPNQLSFLSLGALLIKRRFSAFQDVHWPAHITALLESDLLRIARELQLRDAAIEYSQSGRIVLTPFHYPSFLARLCPRLCSDNLLLIARTP